MRIETWSNVSSKVLNHEIPPDIVSSNLSSHEAAADHHERLDARIARLLAADRDRGQDVVQTLSIW